MNKSDRPEVRGTADFYGGAYPLSKTSFFAADRWAGTDSSILRYADTIGHHFNAICAPRKDRDAECAIEVGHISALFHSTALATDNGRAPHYQRSLQGGCCLGGGGGGATPLSTEFWARNHSALEHIDFVVGHGRSGVPLSSTRLHQ